uniref:Uncharacterized protein n=1 Tax=Solanum tuberosum TaxID=4113 RepID=M0ZSZ0_SOLTU
MTYYCITHRSCHSDHTAQQLTDRDAISIIGMPGFGTTPEYTFNHKFTQFMHANTEITSRFNNNFVQVYR